MWLFLTGNSFPLKSVSYLHLCPAPQAENTDYSRKAEDCKVQNRKLHMFLSLKISYKLVRGILEMEGSQLNKFS